MIRQLIYTSSSRPAGIKLELEAIYESSRHNNAIDGVTGLLFSDGYRFVQVLEGSTDAVESTMTRIRVDLRHRDIEVLSDRRCPAREFGHWSMADRYRGERADEFDARLSELLRRASPETRAAFSSLLEPA